MSHTLQCNYSFKNKQGKVTRIHNSCPAFENCMRTILLSDGRANWTVEVGRLSSKTRPFTLTYMFETVYITCMYVFTVRWQRLVDGGSGQVVIESAVEDLVGISLHFETTAPSYTVSGLTVQACLETKGEENKTKLHKSLILIKMFT